MRQPLLKATHSWKVQEAEPGPSDLKLMPFYRRACISSTVRDLQQQRPGDFVHEALLTKILTLTPEMNFYQAFRKLEVSLKET